MPLQVAEYGLAGVEDSKVEGPAGTTLLATDGLAPIPPVQDTAVTEAEVFHCKLAQIIVFNVIISFISGSMGISGSCRPYRRRQTRLQWPRGRRVPRRVEQQPSGKFAIAARFCRGSLD